MKSMKTLPFMRLTLIICAAFGIAVGQEIEGDDPKSVFSIDTLYTEMEVSLIKIYNRTTQVSPSDDGMIN